MKILWLFVLFVFSSQGRLRITRWRALRKHCLVRAYAGTKTPKGIE